MQKEMKTEGRRESAEDGKVKLATNESHVDFNRLYGDLCRKLMSTPVREILPGIGLVPGVTANHVTSSTGSESTNNIHPAFPTFSKMAPVQLSYLTNIYNQNGPLMTPVAFPEVSPKRELSDVNLVGHSPGDATHQDYQKVSETNYKIGDTDKIDTEKLVDEFKMKLEQYGVPQRFAARVIMHDTASHGSLSIHMEKGRNKKWEELSPHGKISFMKMKAWLESKHQQMLTLDMLKKSQELRKNNFPKANNTSRETNNTRGKFNTFQLTVLCRLFQESDNPPMYIRNAAAERLGISFERVNVWFQNQRARGFPAQKILQQTSYDSYMDIDVENMKNNIKEAKCFPIDFPGSMDVAIYNREVDQTGSTTSPGNVPTYQPAPSIASGLNVRVKPELEDTSAPLDLSSGSNSGLNRSSTSASPVTYQPTAREISMAQDVNDNAFGDDNTKHIACNINSVTKSVTSGAVKRKRGSWHQPIRSASETETHSATDVNDTDDRTKRRKLAQVQAPVPNYTYVFETPDISFETLDKTDVAANCYDYIIKTD